MLSCQTCNNWSLAWQHDYPYRNYWESCKFQVRAYLRKQECVSNDRPFFGKRTSDLAKKVCFLKWIEFLSVAQHSYLPRLIFCLKRSPTPKLGDLRPNVVGNLCVNSLFSYLVPEIDWNRLSFEKECAALVGELLTASCVNNRHLCLPLL